MRPLRPVCKKKLKKVSLSLWLPFKPQSAVKFALHAIIPKSQQSASFLDSAAIILLSFSADPISVSPGSRRLFAQILERIEKMCYNIR